MKAGKLSESVLKRSVIRQLHTKSEHLVIGPGIGMDYSALEIKEGEIVVLSTQPVTLAAQEVGRLGIVKALNNVAASGAKPVGVMVSLLVPTSMTENALRDLIKEIDMVSANYRIPVVGGHSEVTRLVERPLVTVTGVGLARKEGLISPSKVCPGMDIVVTKWIGMEGTAILATEKAAQLQERYSVMFLEKAQNFMESVSVLEEAAVAVKSGVSAMHDVSEGGIFGALWELAAASGVGLEIELRKIPIRQETVEICEFFDLNPYKLLSGGSMLMAAQDGNALVLALAKSGIEASVIGKATAGNDRVLINDEERRFLETTQTDELYRILK